MSVRYHWEHAEVTKLVHDVGDAGDGIEDDLKRVVKTSATMLQTIWRRNADITAGDHGVHYPKTIKAHVDGLVAEIRPDAGLPQGGMSFEYGSRNQKPHLDMNRAADIVFPWFHKQVAEEGEIRL